MPPRDQSRLGTGGALGVRVPGVDGRLGVGGALGVRGRGVVGMPVAGSTRRGLPARRRWARRWARARVAPALRLRRAPHEGVAGTLSLVLGCGARSAGRWDYPCGRRAVLCWRLGVRSGALACAGIESLVCPWRAWLGVGCWHLACSAGGLVSVAVHWRARASSRWCTLGGLDSAWTTPAVVEQSQWSVRRPGLALGAHARGGAGTGSLCRCSCGSRRGTGTRSRQRRRV